MSTDVTTTKRRRPWACSAGHHHMSQWEATKCSFRTARAKFRRLPDDEREPLERGQIDWPAVGRGLLEHGLWLLGAAACVVGPVVVVAALQFGIVRLFESGHEAYLLAVPAAVALAVVGVLVVRRPRVRRALRWLREAYS